MHLGPLCDAAREAVATARAVLPRIWDRDHTVWGPDPTEIADRLGWLDAPGRSRALVPGLHALVDGLRADGITDVLLVGMGGSSLYPQVLAEALGPAEGGLRLTVLDSTDPGAVLAVEAALPWDRTLLVPASSSGTTIETICHRERFLARLTEAHGDAAGRFVVPITDPGSQLDARAAADGYRAVVHGQPDVGGRFSALTAFGLLPAALLGLDVEAHLAVAEEALVAARTGSGSPAVELGAVIAAAAQHGRDKLTIVLPDRIAVLGRWIEQLVAESTGKQGVGVVPVLGESPDDVRFGADRLVVAYGHDALVARLGADGVPVVQLPYPGTGQLPGEVVRWELATAVAGALLGVNPFDQPDVAAAKAATTRMLATGAELPRTVDPATVLGTVRDGDYLAVVGFVAPGSDDEAALHHAASQLRARFQVPVTVGVGPRYLHSTGQLHKGGPDHVVVLLAVGADPVDAEVPGRGFGFSRLKRVQAAGDLEALGEAGRRVAHVSIETLRAG